VKPLQNEDITTELDHSVDTMPRAHGHEVLQLDSDCNIIPTRNGHQNAELGHVHSSRLNEYRPLFKIIQSLAIPIWPMPEGDWATQADRVRNARGAKKRQGADAPEGIPNGMPELNGHLATGIDSAGNAMPIVIEDLNSDSGSVPEAILRFARAIIRLRLALVRVQEEKERCQPKSDAGTLRGA